MSWFHFTRNYHRAIKVERLEQQLTQAHERAARWAKKYRTAETQLELTKAMQSQPLFKDGQKLGNILIHHSRERGLSDRIASGVASVIALAAGTFPRFGSPEWQKMKNNSLSRWSYRCSNSETDELVTISERELLQYLIDTVNKSQTHEE